MKLNIPDMNCGHCRASVEKAIALSDATAQVRVDLASRTAEIDTTAGPAPILAALAAAGYPATLAG